MTIYARYIFRGSSATFLIRVVGVVLGFVLQIVLAHVLGIKEYGIYTYLFGLLTLLSAFPRLGLPSALPRFLPIMMANQQWGPLKGTLLTAYAIPLGISLLFSAVVLVIGMLNSCKSDTNYAHAFWSIAVVLPLFTLMPLQRATLLSFKRIVQSEIPLNIIRPVLILSFVVALSYLSPPVNATDVMMAMSAAIVVAAAVCGYYIVRAIPFQSWHARPKFDTAGLFKVAMPLMLMAGFGAIIGQFTIICIGWFEPVETVALFGVCMRIALLVAFALQAVDSVLHPLVAELFHTKQKVELQNAVTYAARIITAVSVITFIAFSLGGKFILSMFGEYYENGYPILIILLAAQLINALSGTVGSIMKMTNNHTQACFIMMMSAVCNVLLCLVLIPAFGIYGAGIAVIGTMAIWNGTMLIYVIRKIGLNPTALPLLNPRITSQQTPEE